MDGCRHHGVPPVGTRCLIEAERAAKTCRECSLWKGTTLVYDDGPSSADLMFVGEAPGGLEDKVGRPFVGAAGRLLNAMLSEIGIRRGDVYVTNIVKHRPTKNENGILKNRSPNASEIKACKPWLDRQIKCVNPKLIVPLGNVAAQAILGTKKKIGEIHGRRFHRDGRTIIPTFHPAGVRSNAKRTAFREDFAAIRDAYRRLQEVNIQPIRSSTRMRLQISVRGVEPSTVRSGPTPWRLAIAQAVKDAYADAPYTPAGGTTFAVEVEFHLVAHRLFIQPNRPGPPDLDNLLKPLLDTLFTSDNVEGPTGALIDANDTYVTEVRASKTEAPMPDQQGADIIVRWND